MQLRNSTLVWSAIGLLAVGAATGLSAHGVLQPASPTAVAATSDTSQATSSLPIPLMTAPNYRAIVARNEPAVVGITTEGPIPTGGQQQFSFGGPNGDDNPLSQFFRGFQMPRSQGIQRAQGSGFVISADGLVLTNAHVVDGAKEVTVKLSDHREYKAKVLGADKSSDIAVLKINAHNLPTVTLGNSDKLGVGDYVLAIGEPFGLEETATAGIVSAKGRSLPGDGYVPFIQTDAAVNPGNSGGPLFDSSGAVVGINAQIYSNSGGFQGVSFAIPINLAVRIKDQIVKTGKVEHSRLGVEVQTMNQTLADSFKLGSPNGALVAKVVPDSAAAQAGIKVGDVILNFNGAPVIDAGMLSQRVGMAAPGEKASIEVWRSGKTLDLTATIGNAATNLTADNDSSDGSPQARLGLALRPLSAEERQQAGVPGGLVVEDAQGRAAEAGIQPGDVVLSVDGTAVETVAQLRKMVKDHDRQVALLIQRGDARLFIPVTLG
ncbi:MAG: Do family serine endopeptidase [Steroidobacteraceae bacterium]